MELLCAGAESLPFEDSSFDTIVATYILCTTPDPALVLSEIHRLLRPGGRYLFVEHVHAGEGTPLGRFQDLVELPHRYLTAGCHPNRRTEQLLERSRARVGGNRAGPPAASGTNGTPEDRRDGRTRLGLTAGSGQAPAPPEPNHGSSVTAMRDQMMSNLERASSTNFAECSMEPEIFGRPDSPGARTDHRRQ